MTPTSRVAKLAADVLAEPTNYCKYTTVTASTIVNMKTGYCPDIVNQIQEKLRQVTRVISKNKGQHPKEESIIFEEPVAGAINDK